MSDTATHTKGNNNLKLTPSLGKDDSDMPVEIYQHIIELLADMLSAESQLKLKKGMKTISLVSKTLRALALPYMFSEIKFNGITSDRCSGFARLLIDHPRVSRRVQKVEFHVSDKDGDEKLRSRLKANVDTFKALPLVQSVIINDKRRKKKDRHEISSITWLPLLNSYIQSGLLTVIGLCNVVDPPIIDILRVPNLQILILSKCLPKGQSWDLAQAEEIPHSKVKRIVLHGQSPYNSTDGFPIFKLFQGATGIRQLTIGPGKFDFTLPVSYTSAAKWFEKLTQIYITTDNDSAANEIPWQVLYGPPRDDGLVMFPAVKSFKLEFDYPPSLTLRGLFRHMPSLENLHLSYPNHAFRFRIHHYIQPTTTHNLKNLVLQWQMPARRNWEHYYVKVGQMAHTDDFAEEDEEVRRSVWDPLEPMINHAIRNLLLLRSNSLERLDIILHFEVENPYFTDEEDNDDTSILPACTAITAKMKEFISLMPRLLLPALRTVCVDIRMKIPSHTKYQQVDVMDMFKSQLQYQDSARWFKHELKTKVFW